MSLSMERKGEVPRGSSRTIQLKQMDPLQPHHCTPSRQLIRWLPLQENREVSSYCITWSHIQPVEGFITLPYSRGSNILAAMWKMTIQLSCFPNSWGSTIFC